MFGESSDTNRLLYQSVKNRNFVESAENRPHQTDEWKQFLKNM